MVHYQRLAEGDPAVDDLADLDRAGFARVAAFLETLDVAATERGEVGLAEPTYVTDCGSTIPIRPAPCTSRAGVSSAAARAARALDSVASCDTFALM